MLILTRRKNEKVMIGEDIIIEVLGINGNQVKIGFSAPQQVGIMREEIIGQPKKLKPIEMPIPIIKKKRRKIDPQAPMYVKQADKLPTTFYDDH